MLAAYELYAVTGDRDWLRRAYDIIARSAEADLHAAFDAETGLVTGETSFMDWREQSYPRWMEPRDIARSAALSTNVVHYATYRILAVMAQALGEPNERWSRTAEGVREAVNTHLWQPGLGRYAVFRYGRTYPTLAPRSDALAQALAMIYGVADAERGARLVATSPVVEFGPPVFWPFVPEIPSYHNAALWPFVSAYWAWAAAEAGNAAAVEHALASVYRPAALFLTNKENMVASTGHFDGTELNSDRQLWSVAGNLATHYRVLFGMRFQPERLLFRPMVPRGYAGERALSNLKYRNATLTVTIRGFGDGVGSARLDGRPVDVAAIPADLTGAHTLEIEMNGRWPEGRVNVVRNHWSPAAPVTTILVGDSLGWASIQGAVRYVVYRDGRPAAVTTATRVHVGRADRVTEYQVLAVDSAGVESYLSEPQLFAPREAVVVARPRGAPLEREHAGYTGDVGYVRLTMERNTRVEIPVEIRCGGVYEVEPRYANGSGPINTDAKAAIRTLLVDGRAAGVLVMPQRGTDRWSEWGYGTSLRVNLTPGAHTLVLQYTPLDENMDRRVNTALFDHLRLTRLSADAGCR